MSITSITSYASTLEGDQYMADRLHTMAWDEATEAQRIKALKQATRNINRLRFRGYKTDDSQVNEFPRYGIPTFTDDVTPDEIKIATIELAYSLLDGREEELEFENLRASNEGYSSVRRTYDTRLIPAHIAALIPSTAAWALLKPFLVSGRSLLLSRGS